MVAANLQLETLFLHRELGELGAFHQIDDLLDLLEVQIGALVVVG